MYLRTIVLSYFKIPPHLFRLFLVILLAYGGSVHLQAQWIYSQGFSALNSLPELQKINIADNQFIRMTLMADMGDIAFHPDGDLYGVVYDKIYRLDTISSTNTEVYDIGDFQSVGMTIDHMGQMFLSGWDPSTNRQGIALFNPQNSTTRILADFGPINSGFINDIDFYNGELYVVGQLPAAFPEPAVLMRVDTSGMNRHDTITTYTMWPGRALASINDSCRSLFLVSPAESLLNFFIPILDSVRQVDIIPVDGLFYSSGATARTSFLGSIPPLNIIHIEIQQVPCLEEVEAIVTIHTPAGRPATIQYSLDGILFQDSATFINIAPGAYRAYVRDSWGCNAMSVSFEVPDKITPPVTIETTSAFCAQDNGTILLHFQDPTFQFSLDNQNFITTDHFQGVAAGMHSLFVLNQDGCIDSIPVLVDIIPFPEAILTSQPEQCNALNGIITVTNIVGIPPYQFSLDGVVWLDDNVFDHLSTGDYTVLLKDSLGCIISEPVHVAETGHPMISEIIVSQAHCGMMDGMIEVIGSSDHSSLQYSLNGGQYSTDSIFLGLGAGTFFISVRDTFGCTNEADVTINSLDGPLINVIDVSPEYCGLENGVITVNATSAGGGLNYAIDGGTFVDDPLFSNLAAGVHQVIVRDSHACITQSEVIVDEIPAVQIESLEFTEAACGSNNGSIHVISGQQSITGYSLDNISYQDTALFDKLAPGSYLVYLLSHDICIDSAAATISQQSGPIIEEILIEQPVCREDSGSVSIIANGGTGKLFYSLNGGTTRDSVPYFEKIPSAEYLLAVIDENGCIATTPLLIESENTLRIKAIETTPRECLEINGKIRIQAEGKNLVFVINDSLTAYNGYFENLRGGIYHLHITDELGCMLDTTLWVSKEECDIYVPNVFSPNQDGTNDEFSVIAQHEVRRIDVLELYDRWGNVVFSCTDPVECIWTGTIDGSAAPPGVYAYRFVYMNMNNEIKELAGEVTLLK